MLIPQYIKQRYCRWFGFFFINFVNVVYYKPLAKVGKKQSVEYMMYMYFILKYVNMIYNLLLKLIRFRSRVFINFIENKYIKC